MSAIFVRPNYGPAFQGSDYTEWCANEACVMCLEPLCAQETVTLGCGHTNHAACLAHGIGLGKLTCPECRRSIVSPPSMLGLVHEFQRQNGMAPRDYETPIANYEHVFDEDDEGELNLQTAAVHGLATDVARFLAAGADVHADNDAALRFAAEYGHEAVVAQLLAAGANVHADNDAALRFAAEYGHEAVVALLLAAGGRL